MCGTKEYGFLAVLVCWSQGTYFDHFGLKYVKVLAVWPFTIIVIIYIIIFRVREKPRGLILWRREFEALLKCLRRTK